MTTVRHDTHKFMTHTVVINLQSGFMKLRLERKKNKEVKVKTKTKK